MSLRRIIHDLRAYHPVDVRHQAALKELHEALFETLLFGAVLVTLAILLWLI